MQKIYIVLLVILASNVISSCALKKEPEVVSDLASQSGNIYDNLVYVEENGELVPFIVAEEDYNGEVLLIRKDILPMPRKINKYGSYYEDSDIDKYLNDYYCKTLAINRDISNSKIAITMDNSIGFSGTEVKYIERKVFLLSLTEIGIKNDYNTGKEGNPVSFFDSAEKRIAFLQGDASSWWLRSPNTYYVSSTYGVGPDGRIGSGNSFDENGIRPCFCVSPTKRIIKKQDATSEKMIFCLS